MASKIGLAYRREAAMDRLAHQTNRLASRGVNVGSEPTAARDPDAAAVDRLVYTADLLDAAVERIDELARERDRIADAYDAATAVSDVVAGPPNGDGVGDPGPIVAAVPTDDGNEPAATDAEPDELDGDGGSVEGVDYAAMTVSHLRGAMDARGIEIPSGAKKADLVAILTGADSAEQAGPPPADPDPFADAAIAPQIDPDATLGDEDSA